MARVPVLLDRWSHFLERSASAEDLASLARVVGEVLAGIPAVLGYRVYLPVLPSGRVELAASGGAPADAPFEADGLPPAVQAVLRAPEAEVRALEAEGGAARTDWLVPLRYRRDVVGVLALTCASDDEDAFDRWLGLFGWLVGAAAQDLIHAHELHRQEIELRSITCSATDAIILADGEGRITFWNWAAERLFGYTQGEALGQDLHRLLAPDDYIEPHLEGFRRFRATGEGTKIGQIVELPARHRDGAEIPVEISVTAVDSGEGLLVVGIVRDIRERRRAEQELRESAARYRGIVEDQTEFICRYRPDGTLTFVNEAWCRYFGVDAAEVLGQVHEFAIPEEDRRRLDGEIEGLGSDTRVASVEHRVVLPDGSVRWQHWTDRAVLDERGAVIEYQAVGRDVTTRRAAEEALREAHANLERRVVERTLELSRANETLVREIAQRRSAERALLRHREQLRSMSSQLSLAEERERRLIADAVHDDIGQCLALCRLKLAALGSRAGGQAAALNEIGALLDGAIHNTRTLTFELSTPILYDLGLVAAVEWLCERLEAQHGLRFDLRAPERPLDLDTDLRVLLFRGVREILHNTVKHAQATRVWISIGVARQRIRVLVEDDGVGFPEGRGVAGATGFGLFAIRERVTALGGTFRVGRRRGGGATVLQSIPLRIRTAHQGGSP